jgi:predicted nicotinamide N-methyase
MAVHPAGRWWPAHLDWVIAPADGPQRELATDDEDVTCLYQWPVGATLAARLADQVSCQDRRVADLGCGLGSLGLSALALDAREVLFADGSAIAIDLLQRTITLNGLGKRARAERHRWGEPLPAGPWDVILGGDILYRPDYFPQLLSTIATSLSNAGCALLSDPRTTLEERLPDLAATQGLTWTSRRDDAVTIITLRRR